MPGNITFTCLRILERHYNQVGLEIKQGRNVEWRNIETVEQIAGITCNPIYNTKRERGKDTFFWIIT